MRGKKPDSHFNKSNYASDLKSVFNPESVAVIGASTTFGKWGQFILSNIVGGEFKGKIYPVNPTENEMFGLKAFRNITDIPDAVDLAFITTPAKTVPAILNQCAQKGVKGVVLITAGFSETDEAGKSLENEIVEICRHRHLPVIGPNTMGIICPYASLFATGTHTRPEKGSVGFISQSGNLGNQLIHWAEQQGIGVSLFAGIGNEAIITCTDCLEYLENDPHTKIIILYVESVVNGAHFIEVARRVNRKKPLIVLKGGQSEAGRAAAVSHTGSMSGEDGIFRAACRQAGILNVRVPSELLDLSAGFSSLPPARGNRVGIVTIGGGWGVVTADQCSERGLVVPDIPDAIVETIGRHLPPFWSKRNPVDLVGTRDIEPPIVAVEELLKWEGIDAVICLGIVGRKELLGLLVKTLRKVDTGASSQFLDEAEALFRKNEEIFVAKIAELMETYEKPVIGVSMSRTDSGTVRPVPGRRYSGVYYRTPEKAVTLLSSMVTYSKLSSSCQGLDRE